MQSAAAPRLRGGPKGSNQRGFGWDRAAVDGVDRDSEVRV